MQLGQLTGAGAGLIDTYPWLLIFPALMLATTLVGFSLLGDGLRDALDPRSRRG